MSGEAAGAVIIYVDGEVWLDRRSMVTENPISSPNFDTGSPGVNSGASSPVGDEIWTAIKDYTSSSETSLLPENASPTLVPGDIEMSTPDGRFSF